MPSSIKSLVSRINLLVIHPHPSIRAGSSFLQSLFDGHTNMVSLPYLKPIHETLPACIEDIETFITNFVASNVALFDVSKGYYGNKSTGGYCADFAESIRIDEEQFVRELRNLLVDLYRDSTTDRQLVDRKSFFVILHLAYLKVWKPTADLQAIKFIVYNPHERLDLDAALADFPELKYIVMLRDPRQNWLSESKLIENRIKIRREQLSMVWQIVSLNSYAKSIITVATARHRIGADRFKAIDLERLHKLNQSAVLQMCSWLDIRFEECLMVSTFSGKPWAGNAAAGRPSSGFNPDMQFDAWKVFLSDKEIYFASNYLANCLRFLEYDVQNKDAKASANKSGYFVITSRQFLVYFAQQLYGVWISSKTFQQNELRSIKVLKFIKRFSTGLLNIFPLLFMCLKRDFISLKLVPNHDLELADEVHLEMRRYFSD